MCVQQNIILTDACAGVANPVACAGVYHGLLTKGLQATLITYANLLPELLSRRGTADGDLDVARVRASDSRRSNTVS